LHEVATLRHALTRVVRVALLLALLGCSRSSSDSVPFSSTPSTPVDRCRWACDRTLDRDTNHILAHRGPVDAATIQALFEEEDRCRAACVSDCVEYAFGMANHECVRWRDGGP
jgi:hypothetical protein